MATKFSKWIERLKHPQRSFRFFLIKVPKLVSDKLYIQCLWEKRMGYRLDLNAPKTYNEKLQWLKLHDRKPVYTTLVDKYAVKGIVAKAIGNQYIIPTISVWDSVEEIKLDTLPNQFVLKTTHDSGSICICKDKHSFNLDHAKKVLKKSLHHDYYLSGREWPYKDVPRRIIAEPYMEDYETHELRDYKFFCFDGKVKIMFIATGRQEREEPYFDFFDLDFNHIDLRHGHPNAPFHLEKPKHFELMVSLSEKLSRGIPQVRVDFYVANDQVYFGEMTFFHHGGFMPFDPIKWDEIMGSWINLPSQSANVRHPN